jgi:hypothetical protein
VYEYSYDYKDFYDYEDYGDDEDWNVYYGDDDEDWDVIYYDDGYDYITSIPLRRRVRSYLRHYQWRLRRWLSDPLHIVRRCSVCGKRGTLPGEKECVDHRPLPF